MEDIRYSIGQCKRRGLTETITNGNSSTMRKQIQVEQRKALPKMYWIPIAANDLRKAPQLEQNPGC